MPDDEVRLRPPFAKDNPLLAEVVERNICRLLDLHDREERGKSLQEHIADWVTAFSGSMLFLYLHVIWFGIWIALNLGWLRARPFDPFPFGLLTMIVSLEAIFLSTFVLISQNRMQAASDKRANLDLQINLLAEHEVTRLIKLVDAIADHLGIEESKDSERAELEREIAPEVVLEEMERRGHAKRNSPAS